MFYPKVIFETQSPFSGEIKVTESNGERQLIVGGFIQSKSLGKNGKSGGYWDAFAEFDPPDGGLGEVLILGLGAGTMVKLLTQKFGPVSIDAVEIDPVIADVAKKYFGLTEDNVKIIIDDAASYVNYSGEKYDLVCVDTFRWGETPSQCQKEEFYQNLTKVLKKNGVVIFNRIISDHEAEEIKKYADYLEKFFDRIEILAFPGATNSSNVIFYGKERN
jgi:spermidine synthase